MIEIILGFLLKLGIIAGICFILHKIGAFRKLKEFTNFMNTETSKKQKNKSRIIKLRNQLRKQNRLCDEL